MTAKTDRELLELAAKAWGVPKGYENNADYMDGLLSGRNPWNPLTNDGDALRLAVKLGVTVSQHPHGASANAGEIECTELFQDRSLPIGTICESTRRAIVRAAAVIGETL